MFFFSHHFSWNLHKYFSDIRNKIIWSLLYSILVQNISMQNIKICFYINALCSKWKRTFWMLFIIKSSVLLIFFIIIWLSTDKQQWKKQQRNGLSHRTRKFNGVHQCKRIYEFLPCENEQKTAMNKTGKQQKRCNKDDKNEWREREPKKKLPNIKEVKNFKRNKSNDDERRKKIHGEPTQVEKVWYGNGAFYIQTHKIVHAKQITWPRNSIRA